MARLLPPGVVVDRLGPPGAHWGVIDIAVGQAHSGWSVAHLRNRVLPVVLAGTAHDEEVAGVQDDAPAWAAMHGTESETTRSAEADDRNDGIDRPGSDAIGVSCHTVRAVAVVVDNAGSKSGAVATLECINDIPERWTIGDDVGIEVGMEAGFVDDAPVHRAATGPPAERGRQIGQQHVGAMEPSMRVVDPAVLVEVLTLHCDGVGHPGRAASEQRSLIGEHVWSVANVRSPLRPRWST